MTSAKQSEGIRYKVLRNSVPALGLTKK